MSSALYRLGAWVTRRAGLVLTIWLVTASLMGALAAGVAKGTDDAFTIPGSESQLALDELSHTFPEASGTSALIVLTVPAGQRADGAQARRAVAATLPELNAIEQVSEVISPYESVVRGQVSDSGRAVLISVPLTVGTFGVTQGTRDQVRAAGDRLASRAPPGSDVSVGGQAFANIIPRLSWVEGIGVVIALLALLALFRSLLAAVLPLITAVIGVAVAIAMIYAATAVVTVSSTAPMLAIMLGLAVAIDYGLLILSRHRDQLASGMPASESIARAVATAGSAVVFAGLTVVIALLGLGVVGIPFLTVMGVGAAVAVVVALAVALTLLPAAMALAGERLRPRPRRSRGGVAPTPAAAEVGPGAHQGPQRHHIFHDLAHRWVSAIVRRPLLVALGVTAVVALLAIPAPSLRLGLPDNGAQPVGTPARTTYDVVAREFGPGYNGPLVVTAGLLASNDPLGVMAGLKKDIEALPGVKLVALATPNRGADTGIVQVIPTSGPLSPETSELVDRLRANRAAFAQRYGVDIAVTGFTAVGIDVSAQLRGSLAPFAVVVAGLCLILLTLVFRSVAVPIKATVGYLLSVVAAFGVTALVFTQGVFAEVVRVTQVGAVISFLPILLMGVLFGLAMDYEVFLVSRMSEEHVHTRDPYRAIVDGFTGSAPVVTTAAVIMLAVFAAFIPAENPNLKPIAFALTVGVFVDAFLVRMTFVPAVMQLLGPRAWQLPRRLERRLPRLDIEGEGVLRELRLADWPEPGADDALSSATVRCGGSGPNDQSHLPPTRLRPGEVLVVQGAPTATSAIALAVSGRSTAVRGDLKAAGLVLPERARSVRRLVAYLPAAPLGEAVAEIRDATGAGLPLLVLDQADRWPREGSRDLARSALAEFLSSGGAAVLTCADPAELDDLIPSSARRLVVSLSPLVPSVAAEVRQ